MPNRINRILMDYYKTFFKDSPSVVSIGYPGQTVHETNALRTALEKAGFDILFVRNNLVSIAFKELGHGQVDKILDTQTALCIGGDIVSLARFLVDFQKKHEKVVLRGALVDGAAIVGESAVKGLAKTPTKEELKSIISGQILSVGARLSGSIISIGGKLASQIEKKSKEEAASA
jgi:large subunit ribosomal protein L10